MAIKETVEVEVKSNVGDVSKGASDAAGNIAFMGVSLNTVKAAMLKLKTTSKMLFSTVKAGIMSTGIGALLIAFVALRQYFTDNEKGASKLKIITSGLGVVFGNITDVISNLGEKLFKTFSDPKKAIKDLWKLIKENLLNRVTGMVDVFKAAGKVMQSAIKLDWDGVKEGAAEMGESMAQVATGVDDVFNKVKDGINDAKDALTDFVEQTKKEVAQSTQLEKDRLALQQFERKASVDKARTEKNMMKLRVKARDYENETAEDRLKYMREANKLADEQLKKDLHVAREKLRFQIEENSYSKSSQENLDAEAALRVQVYQIERSNWSERKRLKSEEQAIVRELAAKEKSAALLKKKTEELDIQAGKLKLQRMKDETNAELTIRIKAAEKLKAQAEKDAEILEKKKQDSATKLNDLEQQNTLALIEDEKEKAFALLKIQEDKEKAAVELMENSEALKAAITKKYEIKNAELTKKWAKMAADSKLDIMSQTAGNMVKILGEETEAGKAMAVTQATIDTYKGATAAYSAMAGIPYVGPILGAIAAGAAVASGLANVKAILSADSSGGVDDKTVKTTAKAPAPEMLSGKFELGGGQAPEPLKAFVVTDEMTNSQDQLANIRRRATV